MKQMMVLGFAEIVGYAEKELDIHWNRAIDILVEGDFYVGTIYKESTEVDVQPYRKEAAEIIKSFMDKYKLEEMYIKPNLYI